MTGQTFPHVRVDGTGHIGGVPSAGECGWPANKLVLLDASRIAKWTGTLETAVSGEAMIEMVERLRLRSTP